MHCVGSYSFIHSFTRSAHSSGAEQLVQHFRILLAIISYKHTVENDLIMKRKLTACCPCLLVFPLSLLFVLSRSHALGGSSCCCHLGLHSSAKHPFPPFAVPPSLSLVVSFCDMMWYVALCLCVCVCVSFMHISNRAAYCSPPSRTDIPLHWGPHRALPLYSNCCPASSLAALLLPLYLPRVQSQPEPSADAAEPRQQGQLKHICIMPVCLWSGRKLIRCIGLDLCPTTRPELVQQQ